MTYLISQYLVALTIVGFAIAILLGLQAPSRKRLMIVGATAITVNFSLVGLFLAGRTPASPQLIQSEFVKLSPAAQSLVKIHLISRDRSGLKTINTAEYMRLVQSASENAPMPDPEGQVAI